MATEPEITSNTTIGRLNLAFESAREARDLVVELTSDSRLQGAGNEDLRGKLDAIHNAVAVVMSNA